LRKPGTLYAIRRELTRNGRERLTEVRIMSFSINSANEISKLLAFIRVAARGEFRMQKELMGEALLRLQKIAREQDIHIEVVSPSGERIVEFTTYGVMIGSAIGYWLANVPGAIIGAAVGGMIGRTAAHLTIVMNIDDDPSAVIMSIA
jgi:hypothetical protein